MKNCSDITPLALQKLLYYAQGFYKVFTDEYLFYNNCEAWVHGPVYRSVYYKYKNYGYNPIDEKNYDYNDVKLTKIEEEIPWSSTRLGLRDDENSDRIIKKDLIKQYFEDIKEKYKMLNISDIRDYSTALFNKIYR